jgi:hypothetical protein
MGYNARNDEIRDNVTRCGVSGKHNAGRWRLFVASMQRFPLKAIVGSGLRLPQHAHQSIIGWSSSATVAGPWWTWTCVLSRVIPKRRCALRSAMYNARAAMDTAGRASSRWRGIRRFEARKEPTYPIIVALVSMLLAPLPLRRAR